MLPEIAVETPSRSRMTRMNESHECLGVNSCHSSIREIRDKIGDVGIHITVEGGI